MGRKRGVGRMAGMRARVKMRMIVRVSRTWL